MIPWRNCVHTGYRRRIAVPLMLASTQVLWLGTMALLTASTQDRLDITVQRIYKDARDDLEEQWSYYEANLENGLGAEAGTHSGG